MERINKNNKEEMNNSNNNSKEEPQKVNVYSNNKLQNYEKK